MKKSFLKFTAFLLVLAGVAASCNPEEDPYPKEISANEYAIADTFCQWTNLPYDDKVIVINSYDELKKYMDCTEGISPVIDFEIHSLLLVSGYVNDTVFKKNVKDFKQVSSTKYILNLELELQYKDNTEPWYMALIVQKMNDDSDVKLHLFLNAPKIIYPVDISDENIINFFKRSLPMNPYLYGQVDCFLSNIPYGKDTCFVINTMDEFQQIYACTGDLPKIDFKQFTLVIGKHIVYSNVTLLINQKIIENSVLTLLILKNSLHIYGQENIYARYYWAIYPKLPNKPFYVEHKYIWE